MHLQPKTTATLWAGLLAALVLSACTAEPASVATLTVTGHAAVFGQPDMAVVTIGFWTKDDDPAKALANAGQRLSDLTAAVKDLGGFVTEVQTTNFSTSVEALFGEANEPTGRFLYAVNQNVGFTVTDLGQLGAVLDTARNVIGGPYIFGLSVNLVLSPERQARLEAEARDQALAQAHSRAERMAAALGVTLDRPVNVVATSKLPVPDSAGQVELSLEVTYRIK